LALPSGPLPVLAQWFAGDSSIQVTFDQELMPGEHTPPGPWTAVRTNIERVVTYVETLGNKAYLATTTGDIAIHSPYVTYSPPPDQVRSLLGVAAPAFWQFPLTA